MNLQIQNCKNQLQKLCNVRQCKLSHSAKTILYRYKYAIRVIEALFVSVDCNAENIVSPTQNNLLYVIGYTPSKLSSIDTSPALDAELKRALLGCDCETIRDFGELVLPGFFNQDALMFRSDKKLHIRLEELFKRPWQFLVWRSAINEHSRE